MRRPIFVLNSRSRLYKQYVYPVAHFTATRIEEGSIPRALLSPFPVPRISVPSLKYSRFVNSFELFIPLPSPAAIFVILPISQRIAIEDAASGIFRQTSALPLSLYLRMKV